MWFYVRLEGITAVFYISIISTLIIYRYYSYYNNRTFLKRGGSATIKGNRRKYEIVRRWQKIHMYLYIIITYLPSIIYKLHTNQCIWFLRYVRILRVLIQTWKSDPLTCVYVRNQSCVSCKYKNRKPRQKSVWFRIKYCHYRNIDALKMFFKLWPKALGLIQGSSKLKHASEKRFIPLLTRYTVVNVISLLIPSSNQAYSSSSAQAYT